MGLRPALPFEGIAVVLGNDVCRDRVFAEQSAQPIVVSVPIGSEGPDENERQFPEVFTACAVTRAMNRASKEVDFSGQVDGAAEFVSTSNTLVCLTSGVGE